MNKSIQVQAPANIALVKYMGKKQSAFNLPAHGSLSMTLSQSCTLTSVRWTLNSKPLEIHWTSADQNFADSFDTSFLTKANRHVHFLLQEVPNAFHEFDFYDVKQGTLEFETYNTFPTATGIASSASGFAALTLAVFCLLLKKSDLSEVQKILESKLIKKKLADLSRQGSGSSCRSFEGPWVHWNPESGVTAVESGLPPLSDLILVASRTPKKISSSQAHEKVLESPLWTGRIERVDQRLARCLDFVHSGEFNLLANESWQEAWEMHSLFHTANPPFSYWTSESIMLLNYFIDYKANQKSEALSNFPIVTMDAGPNLHVLVPTSDEEKWLNLLRSAFPEMEILQDRGGLGASLLALREE